MASTKMLTLVFLLMAGAVDSFLPNLGAAASCDAIIGKWAWFVGGEVTVNPDGTFTQQSGNAGTWECHAGAQGRFTFRWQDGGFVNSLALSPDGQGLTSTDPSQWYVTAKRIGAPSPAPGPTPSPSVDAEKIKAFVRGGVTFALHHELGHLLIDEYSIPVTGREEDSADSYAAFALGPSAPPLELIAFIQWLLDMGSRGERERAKLKWWAEHSLEEQRAFQLVCLLAGMRPEHFSSLPGEFGAPEARVQQCQQEANRNMRSWQVLLLPAEGVIIDMQKATISYHPAPPELADDEAWLTDSYVLDWLARDIGRYKLPQHRIDARQREQQKQIEGGRINQDALNPKIKLIARSCGESNAYYRPGRRGRAGGVFSFGEAASAPQIIVCYELVKQFRELANCLFDPDAKTRPECSD
jgi:hypothetical protein